jgi:putative hemolysin
MRLLSIIAAPIVHLLSVSTDGIIRLLGVKPSTEPSITPEEIKILIEQGRASGVFEEIEQEMIESILRLDERQVDTCMTPRTQIVWFDLEESPDAIRHKIATSQHSRFPVIEENLDNVLGIVHAKDLLTQLLAGQPLDLQALLRPPLYIPKSMSALKMLDLFKEKRTHLALIIDEYGGTHGIVTHNDILEDIAGNIPATSESDEPEAVRREDGSWLLGGLLPIDELKGIFDLGKLADEENYRTVGGFVTSQVGTIPTVGQRFEWGELRFEVVDMDGHRVDKVLVMPPQVILPISED